MDTISDERIREILANGFELRHDEIASLCRRALEAGEARAQEQIHADNCAKLEAENARLREQLANLLTEDCGGACGLHD